MKRSTVILSTFGACLLAGIWVGSPFFAAHQMIAAAESGNDDDVFSDFDIAKVRENLRPILTEQARPDDKDVEGSMAGGLELLGTPRLVDTMLDTMLTPERLGNLVRYAIMAKPDPVPPRNYAEQYESPNVFILDITPGDAKPAELRFEREGVLSWRVTRITLPALEASPTGQTPAASAAPSAPDTQAAASPPAAGQDQNPSGATAQAQPTPLAQPSTDEPPVAQSAQPAPDDAPGINQQQ